MGRKRGRRIVPGGSVRIRRPDAAKNGRPKKVMVVHAGGSLALLRDPLNLRTRVGRAYATHKQGLAAHVGGDPTLPQHALIDQAARLNLLTRIAWGELMRNGAFRRNGEPHPALDVYRKAASDERAVLQLLGLERKARDVPRLGDVLRAPEEDTQP